MECEAPVCLPVVILSYLNLEIFVLSCQCWCSIHTANGYVQQKQQAMPSRRVGGTLIKCPVIRLHIIDAFWFTAPKRLAIMSCTQNHVLWNVVHNQLVLFRSTHYTFFVQEWVKAHSKSSCSVKHQSASPVVAIISTSRLMSFHVNVDLASIHKAIWNFCATRTACSA